MWKHFVITIVRNISRFFPPAVGGCFDPAGTPKSRRRNKLNSKLDIGVCIIFWSVRPIIPRMQTRSYVTQGPPTFGALRQWCRDSQRKYGRLTANYIRCTIRAQHVTAIENAVSIVKCKHL